MRDFLISNYKVIRLLGHRGMGAVYLAEDLALGRQVALKILNPHIVEDRTFMARFRARVQIQTQLLHPNITLVYAFEEWQDQALLVMEYLDGESLEDRIQRQGRLHAREALAIFREVLPAIRYAHSQGVIHGDLKPSKIFITKNEAVKIMDFGIALHLGETTRLTDPDHIIGALHYRAPEQLRGQALDYRTDIYALGGTLFEMVTGRLPFDGRNGLEILMAHVSTPPPSPRTYGSPDITPALEGIILKALEKNPAARFATVQEFLQEFEASFSSASIVAKSIGISLGYQKAVMTWKHGTVHILQNAENKDFTPCAVGAYKGEILVGTPALVRMNYAPQDSILHIKRLIGRAFNDPEVQKAKNKKNFILYDIVPPTDGTEDSVRVIMGGKPYSPVQISTLILAKLKKDAEARLGDTVDQAVITVPAYFSEKQRYATREAGWKAGLKVQKILAEPTAAAIAYGFNNLGPEEAKTLLVYDFGGGTLDITVLQVVGNVFVELDKEGDMWLGGDDFDELIVNYALDKIKEDYGIDLDTHPLPQDRKDRFKMSLRREAEKAKVILSSAQRAHLVLQGMLEDEDRNIIDIEVSITRAQFDRLAEGLVGRSLDLVKTALKNAKITPEQIDHVLLVGGSTTIPLVQRSVAALFGEDKLLRNIDPMKCVAQGAAIVAAVLDNRVECPSCWANVTSLDYGIQIEGMGEDEFYPIIIKGSPIPSPEPYRGRFYTQRANQRRLRIAIYRGETNKKVSENEKMCIVWILLPAGLPEGTPVEVSLALSGDEILDFIGVKLLDGSGKQLEAFPARGEGERAKLEDDIEQAYKKWEEKMPQADSSTVEEIEQLYDEVVDAAAANNLEMAASKLMKFETKVAQVGVVELKLEDLQNIIDYSEKIMDRHRTVIPADVMSILNKLVEEAKDTIKTKNQLLGKAKCHELVNKNDWIMWRILMGLWSTN